MFSLFSPFSALVVLSTSAAMLFLAVSLASLAAGTYSQFLRTPTGLTTTKGHAGYNVRWTEVPTGPDGICELVRVLMRTSIFIGVN